jgi:hypothetical protein
LVVVLHDFIGLSTGIYLGVQKVASFKKGPLLTKKGTSPSYGDVFATCPMVKVTFGTILAFGH